MKKVIILIFLTGISLISKSQSSTPFNITNLKFKDQKYKCVRPAAIKFSTDENFLYIGFNTANNFKFIKYDCEKAKIEYEYYYDVKNVNNFVISPDEANVVLFLPDGMYYLPSFQSKNKVYKMASAGNLSGTGWMNENQICSGAGSIFDISSWTSSYPQNREPEKIASQYIQQFNSNINTNYQLFFEKRSGYSQIGLWVQSIRDPESHKQIFADNNNDSYPYAVSLYSKRSAYFNNDGILIKTGFISNDNSEAFCFEIKNPYGASNEGFWSNEKDNLIKRLQKGEYIEARIFAARFHPVTGETLGPSEQAKAELQIIKIEGNTVTARLAKKIISNTVVNENDYVGFIHANWGKIEQPKSSWMTGLSGFANPSFYTEYHNEVKIKQSSQIKKCDNLESYEVNSNSNNILTNSKKEENSNYSEPGFSGHYSGIISKEYTKGGENIYYRNSNCSISNLHFVDANNVSTTNNIVAQGKGLYLILTLLNFVQRNGKFEYYQSSYMEDATGTVYAKSENLNFQSTKPSLEAIVGGGLRSLPSGVTEKPLYISFKIEDKFSDAKIEGFFKIIVVR